MKTRRDIDFGKDMKPDEAWSNWRQAFSKDIQEGLKDKMKPGFLEDALCA